MRYHILRRAAGSSSAPVNDWAARSTGAGVVWIHDFRSDSEVNNFRWTGGFSGGNDPNAVGSPEAGLVRRITTDGVDGNGCLEILRLAGTDEVGSHWWRPLSPIVGTGNGRGVNDPGAGSITPQAYAPTSGGSQINNWGDRGFYGHSSYHTGSAFDGTEYYLQMRVKMDPRRAGAGMPTVGKLSFQTRTDISLTTQEIVTYSGGLSLAANPGENYFRMYGGGDSGPLEQKAVPSASGNQPNSALGVCTISTPGTSTCWAWSGGWDTVMYHVSPGRAGVAESRIRVYAAHPGETTYTLIWDMIWANDYGTSNPFGYNALILSTYNNNNNCPTDFWHRYDQIIFSQQFIECPDSPIVSSGAVAPDYVAAMTLNHWYALSGDSPDLGLSATNDVSDVMGSLAPFSSTASDLDTPWNDWTGFAIAPNYGTSGALGCNGGGHQGSDWPGWYFWDFATRTWEKDASSAPSTTTITSGLYSNGAPPPTHSSYHPHTRSLTGEVVLCISETNPGTPSSKRVAFRKYDPATHTWSGGAVHTTGGGNSNGGTGGYDPVLDRSIHIWGNEKWYRDWATGTESTFSYPDANDDCPGIFLPANGVRSASYMLLLRAPSNPRPFMFVNTASPSSASTIQATPSPRHADHNSTCCVWFSPGNDSIYVSGATPAGLNSIYRYQCPSTIPGTWTGTEIVATGTVQNWLAEPQATDASNVRGKARLMVFSDGSEVLYLSGWPTHPVYGLRIR